MDKDNYQDSKRLALEKALQDDSGDPIKLPLSFLESITDNFSDKRQIGRGGFGAGYRGELRNGLIVAVKKLYNTIEIREKNFQNEVDCLIKAKHKNIVRFLGYCSEMHQVLTPYEGRSVWAEVWQRLFCFEYLSKGSLADYLTEASSSYQWRVRYQIIKGICEGLGYLHQHHIVHLDLKPQNILLDNNMEPKIIDFGLSKRLSETHSKTITEHIVGTWGYMAPEFLKGGVIKSETDIYSLGVIIIEILTGSRECPNYEKVLQSWGKTFETSESHPLLEQVKVCAKIGIKCMDDNPGNRHAIHDIIRMLDEIGISNSSAGKLSPRLSESEPLDVHPLELSFPFEAKKRISCPLSLINRTDRYVAYRIVPQFPDIYSCMYEGILYPLSTTTLDVDMVEQQQLPLDAGMFEILMIAMESESDLKGLISSAIGKDPEIDGDLLLERVEELGGEVHAATLTAVACPPSWERATCSQFSPAPKFILNEARFWNQEIIDVHPTQPWILEGCDNYVSIWDYKKQGREVRLDVDKEAGTLYYISHRETKVESFKFIPRKQWFVAGDSWGYVHVYSCLAKKEMRRFKVNGSTWRWSSVTSMAIHPTYSYLLSACDDGVIKLWDWEMGWACSQEFQLFPGISTKSGVLVKFNPNDTNTFITGDSRCSFDIKVWSIYDSAQPTTRVILSTGFRHCVPDGLDFVVSDSGQNHVVVIGPDECLNIWDLKTGARVHTLHREGTTRFLHCTAVSCHPTLPLIAAGISDGSSIDGPPVVSFWNSTTYRFEKSIRCKFTERILYLGFASSRRLVVGTDFDIQVFEIDMESLVSHQ